MKRLFNHTRRSYEKWEGYNEDDTYDWDDDEEYDAGVIDAEETDGWYYEEDSRYYADQEADEYYAAEETEEGYYADEETDGGYYASEDEIYYTEDGEPVYTGEEIQGEYYAEEYDDEYYEEGGMYYVDSPRRTMGRMRGNRHSVGQENNLFGKIRKMFAEMGTMDRVITVTGMAVLSLALMTGIVYMGTRHGTGQAAELVGVGSQLEGITLIGEKGLLAVADAEMARQAAAEIIDEEEQTDYDEEDYGSDVNVKLHMTSVMKDLKIKFTNQKTGRLIANVPFSVTVTTPGGKSETWSDDDKDGIIYKKNIKPGTYSVLVNELTEEQYKGYMIPTVAQAVEVKKDIAYDKIDVSDEVKTEDEIDVDKEDTNKKDTEEESTLKDTVEWVESTVVIENYKEVSKSTITDPSMLAMNKVFDNRCESRVFSTVSDGDLVPFTAFVSPASATVGIGGTAEAQITATGYTQGKTLKYSAVSNNQGVATAAVDAYGKVTVTGVAEGTAVVTVTVDYAEGMSLPVQITLPVTVLAKPAIMLDKTTATVFMAESVTITATITNATTDAAVTAESSDTGVATVAVNGRMVVVTGAAEGDAAITVKYAENGEEFLATCAVRVKANPKDNKTDKLKDSAGNQLYVLEGEKYREAVYADYYTAVRFFVKGEAKYTGWQTIDGKVYFFTKNGEKVTGEQVIQGAKYTFASDGSLVTGSGTMGIDVSKWNGTIDWNAVKNSGVSYVIIRCGYRGSSQGMLIEDPKFTANIKGATAAGLKVGVYFFTQATDEIEAVEEASYVLDKIKNYKISYPVFLDVESSGGRGDKIDKTTRTAVCKAFCETIQRNGYTAGIYANKTWLNEKINASALNAYKIWLAQYASTPTYKGRYDLWQYKSTGRVSGIKGDVDLNLSYLGY